MVQLESLVAMVELSGAETPSLPVQVALDRAQINEFRRLLRAEIDRDPYDGVALVAALHRWLQSGMLDLASEAGRKFGIVSYVTGEQWVMNMAMTLVEMRVESWHLPRGWNQMRRAYSSRPSWG